MNKREARRRALNAASLAVQNVLDAGMVWRDQEGNELPVEDQRKIDIEMDEIAQRLWERANPT